MGLHFIHERLCYSIRKLEWIRTLNSPDFLRLYCGHAPHGVDKDDVENGFFAFAKDKNGYSKVASLRFMGFDAQQHNVKPFGYLDTTQPASGANHQNFESFGWQIMRSFLRIKSCKP